MEKLKQRRNRGLLFLFLKWQLLLFLTLLLLFWCFYQLVSVQLMKKLYLPSPADFLDYEDQLMADDYENITLSHWLDGCLYTVLDGSGTILYRSDETLPEQFSAVQLQCIDGYDSESYLVISRLEGWDGRYFISERTWDEDYEKIGKFCILDEQYNILRGTLFGGTTRLTQTEIDFINGVYGRDYTVSKLDFENSKGEPRTLVLFSPRVDLSQFEQTLINSDRLWLLLIPVFILVLILFGLLVANRLRHYLLPLNAAILGLPQNSTVDLSFYSGPREFAELAQNFAHMTVQLAAAQEEKRRMEQERMQMLMDISHDLKTPITVISGYARAIQDGTVPRQEVGQYIDLICRKAGEVSALADSFFAYCKVTRPTFRAELQECDAVEYLQEYFGARYEELELAGFRPEFSFPDTPLPCMLDRTLFRRVLDNLVSNAVRYNPQGVMLFCSACEEEGMIRITFGDDGVGIPEPIADTLFEPFVVGDDSRGKQQGHGLGLAIVRQIVALHGGTVCLIRPPQHGLHVEFCIRLPVV